jgi:adenylate kinase
MLTSLLSYDDEKETWWLLDGYPHSSAQAESLEKLNVRPVIYVVLDVHKLNNNAIFAYDYVRK